MGSWDFGFSLHEISLPLHAVVRDEEVAVTLLGFYWARRAPGWGTANFFSKRFLQIPRGRREGADKVDFYFDLNPRDWSLPLSFGWDSQALHIGLLCFQLAVWFRGSDPKDMPASPEELRAAAPAGARRPESLEAGTCFLEDLLRGDRLRGS